ncbi:alpha/beta hydrolase [Streptomyces sp. NPDC094049]|uniref:alpha/beta fold hydrolase n=1 Tax=Streptomyces sp. NPDC094049 TaxID=3154987 RepID=UPI00332104BC
MNSIYRDPEGREQIRLWCSGLLDSWTVPHERTVVTAAGAHTHLVTAGDGPTTVVFVPGTGFNAATSLPLATALVADGHRVVLADVPGQPGLSSDRRPASRAGLAWYGAWLDEVVEQSPPGPVVTMGHSLGAAICLNAGTSRISRQILVSPAGLTRLRVAPRVAATAAAWSLRPTPARSSRLLRALHTPGHPPREELVTWMTLVARHARSSGAPTVTSPARPVARYVVSGEHDTFLPPRRLQDAARAVLGTRLRVVPVAGHLLTDEQPELLSSLVADPERPDHQGGPAGVGR